MPNPQDTLIRPDRDLSRQYLSLISNQDLHTSVRHFVNFPACPWQYMADYDFIVCGFRWGSLGDSPSALLMQRNSECKNTKTSSHISHYKFLFSANLLGGNYRVRLSQPLTVLGRQPRILQSDTRGICSFLGVFIYVINDRIFTTKLKKVHKVYIYTPLRITGMARSKKPI